MDSDTKLNLERAENELVLAQIVLEITKNEKIQQEVFHIDKTYTFYSSVISHAYYAIFYSAKAYLLSKNIILSKQGQHQQVYFNFKKLVQKGSLEKELLDIYEDIKDKAEKLLEIFDNEREKRSNFTYETIPQANQAPAEDSINSARFFVSHIRAFLS